jgi:hypothetical protein
MFPHPVTTTTTMVKIILLQIVLFRNFNFLHSFTRTYICYTFHPSFVESVLQ